MPKKSNEPGGKLKKSAEPGAPSQRGSKAASQPAAKKAAKAKSVGAAPSTKAGAGKRTATESAGAKKSEKKSRAKTKSAREAKAPAAKTAAKARKPAKKKKAAEPIRVAVAGPLEDPIGDLTDGEAHRSLADQAQPQSAAMMEAYRADTTTDAENGLTEIEPRAEVRAEESAEPPPEPKLERLQKILSQAGVASRRHAEEMIVAGRVIVNGQTVTQLGAKADPARDHIRVDGKLIQGAERHRTFALNKPKGFVTTVSDPEGRPTVMQFFEKMRERLYPVGRLDYQSEGLLLMTNDGELANGLTRAAAGVEKTYLVKVAGQPTEEELDQLRSGVPIDREQLGSSKVRTAPALVRQVRQGDNPWYEVVLTEGRNRELRKMFQAVGHFVEKIRRVGYGPLVLDVEPGQFRELTNEEVNALRLTAEGKLKPRRPKAWPLPKEAGRSAGPYSGYRSERREAGRFQERGARSEKPYVRRERPFARGERPFDRSEGRSQVPVRGDRPERGNRTEQRDSPLRGSGAGRGDFRGGSRGASQDRRFAADRQGGGSGRGDKPRNARPGFDRQRGLQHKGRSEGGRKRFEQPHANRGRFEKGPSDKGRYGQPPFKQAGFDRPRGDRGLGRQRIEITEERPSGRGPHERPWVGGRPEQRGGFAGNKPSFERNPRFDRPPRQNREGARGEERQPRRDFKPREEGTARAGRPKRFAGPGRMGGEGKPPAGGDQQQRPVVRRESTPRFRGPGRPSSGNPRGGRPKFGGSPGGPWKSGFRGKPGGGGPQRDRG